MFRLQLSLLIFLIFGGMGLSAQSVPTPRSEFGFEIGADRKMADWGELTAYFEKVAMASPRVQVDTLGASTMGRPFVMLTITSPENHARLEELKEIQLRLADPGESETRATLTFFWIKGRPWFWSPMGFMQLRSAGLKWRLG